jgi:hypothetical protein
MLNEEVEFLGKNQKLHIIESAIYSLKKPLIISIDRLSYFPLNKHIALFTLQLIFIY